MTQEHKAYDGRKITCKHLGLTGEAWVTHAWGDEYYCHVKGSWANGNKADGILCRATPAEIAPYLIAE